MNKDPDSIAGRDWRIQAISTLAEDFVSPSGTLHKAGAAVEWTTFISHRGDDLSFPVPSPPALLLSLAHRLAEDSRPLFARLSELASGIEHEADLFSLIENTMGSIVFSITALEAFANQSIPADFEWRTTRQDGRFDEVYSREQIERFVSLDRKFNEILPTILGVKSPKGTVIWQRYRELAHLRDRVVHLKNSELEPVDHPVPENLWSMVLGTLPIDAPARAIAMIRHFAGGGDIRWVKRCPIH